METNFAAWFVTAAALAKRCGFLASDRHGRAAFEQGKTPEAFVASVVGERAVAKAARK